LAIALLVTAGAAVASNPDLRKQVVGLFKPQGPNLIPYAVTKQKLVITVTERGNLESSKNLDVASEVEGQTTILKILPEGTKVEKGDQVAELDSASLRDNLTNQEITTKRAEADYENAMKTREVAEIAVREYLEGTFLQDRLNIEGEITLAESELKRSIEKLDWSEKMLKNQYISEGQVLADRLSKLKAEISKRQAAKKMVVLEQYTKQKQETELLANVEKARSDELAKKATLNLETTKLEKLNKQIAKCKLLAPGDGLIVYANDTNQFRGNNQPQIEEGAVVRERQKIFSLPDINNMQVNTKVHEAMVNDVEAGQKAKIRVDAFANEPLTGTVKMVQPLPDPSSFFSSDIKVYTTLVTIDQTNSSLRPGMTAEVTILIDTLENVLCIPVTAVLPLKGKNYVYLITKEGPKQQEVELGRTNDIMIEIKKGIAEGDQVAMNPTALLSEDEKNEAFSAAARATTKTKDFGDVKNPPKAGGGEAKPKAKAKGAGGGGMMGDPAMAGKFRAMLQQPGAMDTLKNGTAEEKAELMKKAGFTDEEMQRAQQMRQQGGGGPGGGGFGGGGGPGGGRGPGGGGAPQ
jgi:RND family efflux transporter MFP subunit